MNEVDTISFIERNSPNFNFLEENSIVNYLKNTPVRAILSPRIVLTVPK